MEKRHHALLPLPAFFRRVLIHLGIGASVILISLLLGMWGYSHYEGMNVVDSYVNAAMILSGMGPVQELHTDQGKIFAGSYALFSGIIFLIVIAIFIAPLVHRFLHSFLIKDTK
jgi:hypothetical protein